MGSKKFIYFFSLLFDFIHTAVKGWNISFALCCSVNIWATLFSPVCTLYIFSLLFTVLVNNKHFSQSSYFSLRATVKLE